MHDPDEPPAVPPLHIEVNTTGPITASGAKTASLALDALMATVERQDGFDDFDVIRFGDIITQLKGDFGQAVDLALALLELAHTAVILVSNVSQGGETSGIGAMTPSEVVEVLRVSVEQLISDRGTLPE